MMVAMPIGWETICLLITLMAFIVAVLAHMVAMAFNLPGLNMWAKSEYMQVAVSAMLLLFAVGMRDAGSQISVDITKELALSSGNIALSGAAISNADPINVAKTYLVNGPLECEKKVFNAAYVLNLRWESLSSITLEGANTLGIGGKAALGGWVSFMHYAAQNLTYAAVLNLVQYNVLMFSQYTALQIFFPIGLLLRIFPITRGAGGLLTAFALGLAFVFPISYVMLIAIVPPNACTITSAQAPAAPQGSPPLSFYTEADPCYAQTMEGAIVALRQTNDDENIKKKDAVMELVKTLYLQSFIYPMICLIITFTFIRQTSSLFGTDLGEIGRGLVKLI